MAKKSATPTPKFSDFREINVPLSPVRMEIAALQKLGLETIPLEAFLLMIHKHVKEAQSA